MMDEARWGVKELVALGRLMEEKPTGLMTAAEDLLGFGTGRAWRDR